MKSINILTPINRVQNQQRIDLLGEGKLNQNTVHTGIIVQRIDFGEDLFCGRVGRHSVKLTIQPGPFASSFLVANINLTSRVLTD